MYQSINREHLLGIISPLSTNIKREQRPYHPEGFSFSRLNDGNIGGQYLFKANKKGT